MKRLPGELYYDYCARRLMEKEEVEEKLRPRLFWPSSVLVPDQSDKKGLKRVSVYGTYNDEKTKKKRERRNAKQHRIRSRRNRR